MRIGLYCGTFNPYHIGHHDIYKKAYQIFDQVIVAQSLGAHPDKAEAPPEIEVPRGVTAITYTTLTTDLITEYEKKHGRGNVTLVRGIRNGNDYDYEINQITVMKKLKPDLQVVLIPCEIELGCVSSTMVRTLSKFKPTVAAHLFLP